MDLRIANENDPLLEGAGRLLRMDSQEQHRARLKANAQRFDSLAPGRGMHLARELEYIYSEVLRDDYAPNNAFRLFETDTSVPEGARTHTVRRIQHQGDVRVYRGGGGNKNMPTSGASKVEQQFPVLTYVTSIRLDFFEQQAEQFSPSSLRSELEFAAQQAMRDFANDQTWAGDEDHGLYGIENYPWVPKTVTTVDMTQSGTPADQLEELHRLANLADEKTKQTFSPDTMLLSPRVYNYISTTKRNAENDDTILEAFLANSPTITEVEKVHELTEAGPAGQDLIFFYKRGDKRSVANVIVKEPTMLPIIEDGLDLSIPMYMQHGGVIMRKPLHNLVVYLN